MERSHGKSERDIEAVEKAEHRLVSDVVGKGGIDYNFEMEEAEEAYNKIRSPNLTPIFYSENNSKSVNGFTGTML